MTNVTVKSYRKEREAQIMGNLEKSMGQVGLMVENQAKLNVNRNAPNHPQVGETGALKAKIAYTVDKKGSEITTTIGIPESVYYGKYLELGTVKMPPYPWLFPALESKRSEIIKTIKSGGGSLIGIERNANVDIQVGT